MKPSQYLLVSIGLAAACSDSIGPGAAGSRTERFEWAGQIAPGGTVEIRNLAGDLRARPGSGETVRVRAVKEGRADSPSTVRIEVVETAAGVTICAVYPDVAGLPRNRCAPGGAAQLASRANDVSVRFEIEVPPSRAFVGMTLAGAVEAIGLDGYVAARTISGDIEISTVGLAEATTIAGDITASIGQPVWDRDLSFRAVQGDLSVWLPANTNTDVWGSTGRGAVATDFPLRITRQGASRQLQGRLGSGGRNLILETVSGDIALRTRSAAGGLGW